MHFDHLFNIKISLLKAISFEFDLKKRMGSQNLHGFPHVFLLLSVVGYSLTFYKREILSQLQNQRGESVQIL